MSMEIQYLGGWRFEARCRGHSLTSDQPLEEEGEDAGMTPVELFFSSLGCCIGVYAKLFCERHKIPLEGMKIGLEWRMAQNPSRVSEVRATVELRVDLSE
ncbi:OsmC family protein, partial [Candidatus Bathyarchaeota archaeon]|nr:OsmC family protein [Candidatus Bathyarchaeota archaeon]